MSTTTMHFGPEWMRTKHQPPSRTQPPPSPPPPPPSGASSYSALVSPAHPPQSEKRDETHPFRYTKEEMLKIYKEGGGRGGLGLEVERWEGVVREAASDPVGLRDMGDAEKKLFAGPLNSDLRRRQSTDYLSPLSTQPLGSERPRLNHNSPGPATGSPMRERFSALRRRDSTDPPALTIPRKQSLSSIQGPTMSPRDAGLPSPRTRVGYTPSFDGVLNNGESWVARRRASEASLKSGVGPSRDVNGEHSHDGKASEIREEEEDHGSAAPTRNGQVRNNLRQPSPSPRVDTSASGGAISSENQSIGIEAGIAQMSLGTNSSNGLDSPGGTATIPGPPPGLLDVAAVEWSYKDPSGQVQGPFRADLMQKWYDDGYFTPDLPMKRTQLDTQWITVEELARRCVGDKIFLSLPTPSLPPGLVRRTESPGYGIPPEQNLFNNGPYQPAPIRSLRSSTLDSYLSNGSNASDSPSSSFGGGQFGNGSPDPAAFGARSGNHGYIVGDPTTGGRVSGFPPGPEPFSGLRTAFSDAPADPSHGLRSNSYGNVIPGRGSGVDGYAHNGGYSTQGPWPISNNPITSSVGRGSTDPIPFSGYGHVDSYGNIRGVQASAYNDGAPGHAAYSNLDYVSLNQHLTPAEEKLGSNFDPYAGQGQQYSQSPAIPYTTPQQIQQPASHVFGHHTSAPSNPPGNPNPTPNITSAAHSPWANAPEGTLSRRPGPFEVAHPTASNTVVNLSAPPKSSPWVQTSELSRPNSQSQSNEPSPWLAASQGVVDDNWKEEAPGPNSLTFSNVGQHNQQQQQLVPPLDTKLIVPDMPNQPQTPSELAAPQVTVPIVPTPAPTKSRNKATTVQPAAAPSVAKAVPPPAPLTPSPPPTSQKPAWSTEEEVKKSKPIVASISLREIQEAEAKKAEARKVAERERERAARASVPVAETKEDMQSFTASWGLPTSQAGARGVAPQKDTTSSSPAAPSSTPPVWTTTVKAPTTKKTMKEIQEEEERRKKLATKETMAAAAARRAYAESTNKSAPPAAQAAWTTVGPSGKTSSPVSPPARPPITPSAPTPSVASSSTAPRVNGTPVSRPVAITASKPVSTPRADENPASPSHGFLKWLNDSLKGLNSSVNVEEIMSMLLSFPLDPDPSTVELISDLIYANSTTLDGRRFAAEFVSRRKTDASSRPKGAASAGKAPAKPVSIADVLKATPKPTQPEWGFKVVNKKKKGGRT